jgi:sulfite dehydrogenase
VSASRRGFLRAAGALGVAAGLSACAGSGPSRASGHVVVVGGGFGGATAAKYLRLWSQGSVEVTLIERNLSFISCPLSNLVVSGDLLITELIRTYEGLRKHGVRVVHGEVTALDAERRQLRLASGDSIGYDRAIVAPGVDFMFDAVPGLTRELSDTRILHAWRAGPQTVGLRKQLEEMRDGGVFAICVPPVPYRCPPAPYERATLVAHYLKNNKPKSKVLILDANPDVASKKGLFEHEWQEHLRDNIEHRAEHQIAQVDAAQRSIRFTMGDTVRADVINIIPPHRAGSLARSAGLANDGGRWCGVDWLSFESTAAKNVHVIGDATQAAPAMPKSGTMANTEGKVVAAAIINLLAGRPLNPAPILTNVCYSFLDPKSVAHMTSVHPYDPKERTYVPVIGAGGLSPAPSELEAKFAMAWAKNIWADTLG